MSEEITLEYAKYCVEEYLGKRIKPLVASIDNALMRIRECEERLQLVGIDYSKGAVRTSAGDRLGDGMARLEELHDELEAEISRNIEDVEEARRLCPVSKPQLHALWLHYVQGMPWGKVARAIGFSKSHIVHNMIPEGYRELALMIPAGFREKLPKASDFEDE